MQESLSATAYPWSTALYLAERQRHSRNPGAGVHDAQASMRLAYWKSMPAFQDRALFDERLAADGLTETQLQALLQGRSADADDDQDARPAWVDQLALFAYAGPQWSSQRRQRDATALTEAALGGLLSHAYGHMLPQVHALRQRYPALLDDPVALSHSLMVVLLTRLTLVSSRVLVLELNVARLQGQLDGETAEARFDAFQRRLASADGRNALLHEYTVLARTLGRMVAAWEHATSELLERLSADWPDLCATFFAAGEDTRLVAVEPTDGDPHGGGRTVLCLRFASGRRLVYKPRPVAAARHFQGLLAWMNAQDYSNPFRLLTIVDKSTHGWIEFIPYARCTEPEQVHRFYQRLGGVLGVLYLLGGSDIHRENLIAAGEFPMLIDLETLVRPQIRPHAFEAAFYDSVVAVGLLPYQTGGSRTSQGVDLSGVGGHAGQLVPTPTWADKGTDQMRIVQQAEALRAAHNQPSLDTTPCAPTDYCEDVVQGFREAYALLTRHPSSIMAPDGPIGQFAHASIRFLARHTRDYEEIRQASFHPDVLRDGLDRDRVLDHLWAAVRHNPELRVLLGAERTDLIDGDIPLFVTEPHSRHLWDVHGHCYEQFFSLSGMEAVQRRLERASPADMDRQIWIIRMALSPSTGWWHPRDGGPFADPGRPAVVAPPDRARLLAAARAVADRLGALAWRHAGEATWIGPADLYARAWSISGLGHDVYNGLPGLALFLSYLGTVTGEDRYTQIARDVHAALEAIIEHKQHTITDIGAFYGWGGLIYTYLQLGVLWSDEALLDQAERWIERLVPLIEQDRHLDMIGGSAGCLSVLLAFHAVRPQSAALAVAQRCADWLVQQAQPQSTGVGWCTTMSGTTPWTGFSHGTAGIAWVLLELTALTGDPRYRSVALEAIAYERSHRDMATGTWTDLRWQTQDPARNEDGRGAADGAVTAWCNGATGIGLARVRSLAVLDSAATEEVEAAIHATLERGFGENHCLCHGDLGNIELLVEAHRRTSLCRDAILHTVTEYVVASVETGAWRCGIAPGLEPPGLMVGLAGIGYGLLRLADPDRVPSVLYLDPPAGYGR